MLRFNTINKNIETYIVEKKSKFIANIFYVETIDEAEEYIKQIKKKYHDARHNTFAYAIETGDLGIAVKYNDDGEPQGTAGAPMLKVILENKLSNVLVVVTRYFGGILLGTGGLVRAYTDVTKKAIEESEIVEKTAGHEIKISVTYDNLENLKYYLNKREINILDVDYGVNIDLIIEISKEDLEEITKNASEKKLDIIKLDILKEKFV